MDIQHILEGVQESLTARRVFGEPVRVDDVTIVPVAILRGGGGGGARSADGGVGFGVNARPAGVYVVRDGQATWRPAVDVNRVILGGQLVAIVALLVLGPTLRSWLERRRDQAT